MSYSKIKKYLPKVKLIFISHSHQDHLLSSTIKKIAYNYPTIKFLTGSEVVVEKLVECGVNKKNIYILKSNKKYDLGLLKVKLEELYHDTPNYAMKWEYKGKKGVYIVDTSNVEGLVARDYDLYLIENNYREDILEQHLKDAIDNDDNNKIFYLQRTIQTHLSKSQCDSFLIENMGSNSVYEYVHLSKYNNTENGDFDK
ncbi:MAG: hypothetical protein IKU37_01390 [Candidatus Gastranaerophilales bacterium]|nr:hypothetical protein [Candidatus Gastranaerophilales bacterium]